MGAKFAVVLVFLGILYTEALETSVVAHFEPMVAFMCNKPAMYLTKEGWKKDESTDCLKKPEDILNYCRKVYHGKDITNVVESSHTVEIDNWCRYGKKHCRHHKKHTVTPFRCLEGAFQSDALLVPEHCLFDHTHDSKRCEYFTEWNDSAMKSCTKRDMKLQSFAILLPCGVDRFSGVEFVCCPKEEPKKEKENKGVPILQAPQHKHHEKTDKKHHDDHHDKHEQKHHDDHKHEEHSHHDDHKKHEEHGHHDDHHQVEHKHHADLLEHQELPAHIKPKSPKKTFHFQDSKSVEDQVDEYMSYMHSANLGHYLNEHQRYKAAEKKWLQHHREKITAMMKEWAAARKRVQQMKATDPKAAEKLNQEITSRFQKTYQALEQEGLAQKKQLMALHQQRVQADLNAKKRDGMERYMKALTDKKPKASHILKTLKHYLQTEQKDRMHAVNHYKHMRDNYPEYAAKIRTQTIKHIEIIETRMNQSLTMLKRVPQFEAKIRVQIDGFLKSFHDVDMNIVNILLKPQHAAEKHKQTHHHSTKKELISPPHKSEHKVKSTSQEHKKKAEKQHQKIHKVALHKEAMDVHPFDDETMEDERVNHGPVMKLEKAHVAHGAVSNLAARQAEIVRQNEMENSALHTGSTLGIAVGCIAIFVIIVVAVVVLRKKAQRVPMNHAYVDVDHAVSPEEKHVSNMQINGYENPTYKYFEKAPVMNA